MITTLAWEYVKDFLPKDFSKTLLTLTDFVRNLLTTLLSIECTA